MVILLSFCVTTDAPELTVTVGNKGKSLVVGVMSPNCPCSWLVDTSVLWFSIQRAGASGQTREPGNKIWPGSNLQIFRKVFHLDSVFLHEDKEPR